MTTAETGTGQVIFFDNVRGWGFLRDDNGDRVFWHTRNSPGVYVELGMIVAFDYAPGFKIGQPRQAIRLRALETFATGVQDAMKDAGGQ